MQPIAKPLGLALPTVRGTVEETMPDPLPKPPGRPPGEPIIIKDPSRPPPAPEMERPLNEEEEEAEIKRPPEIIPEMPPPPSPEEQATWLRRHDFLRAQLIEIGVFGDEIVERDRFSGSLAQGGSFAHLVATQLGPLQARAPAPAS